MDEAAVAAFREEMEEMRRELADMKDELKRVEELEALRTWRAEMVSDFESCVSTFAAHGLDWRTDECISFGLDRIAWIDLQMSEIQLTAKSVERRQKADEEREEEEKKADEEREEEQAVELDGEQTSRSGSSAQDGQEALLQPHPIERSPFEPVCWVSPGAIIEQVAPFARHVETHPAVTREIPSHAEEKEVGEMVLCTSGRGFKEEEEQEEEEEQQEQQQQQQQQQQGSKEGWAGGKQHHLQQGCVWTSMEAGPRWRVGAGLMPPFSPD